MILLRAGLILSGPLYGALAGFAVLGGVSIFAEALGHRTGFEVLVMAIWAAGFAGLAGTLSGLAAALRHRTRDGLARALSAMWRYQLMVLPAIVIFFTLLQLSVDPVPA